MTRVARVLREMFLRPAGPPRSLELPRALPDNVVPLRVGAATGREDAARRALSARGPSHAAVADDLAPRVVLVGLAGVGERWLALATAAELRRIVDSSIAFVVEADTAPERNGAGEAHLRLGAARVLLPFAARRHAGRVMSIGAGAALRHEKFLRALGPVVWNVGAADGRDALRGLIVGSQAIVLARPVHVDVAYSEILAAELRADGVSCDVIRVVTGLDRTGVGEDRPDDDAGEELIVPCATLDRWLGDRGLRCGPAMRRGARLLAEAIVGGSPA